MASHRWRPVIISGFAVLLIWALAITGFMLAKNSRLTADRVREFSESVDLNKLSPADRTRTIHKLADKLNALPADERRRAQLEHAASGTLAQMTEEEKDRFIEETTPAGFKQMLTAFEKLPEERRSRTVQDALRRLREAQIKISAEDGDAVQTNALPQMARELQKIRTLGLAEFYSQSSAQTKAELAPILEELQKVMESGRPFRGR